MSRLVIFFVVLVPLFTSCGKDNDTDLYHQIRETAWNSLSSTEKATVTVSWEKATVSETVYQQKDVYAVTFNTSEDPLLGPIVVYLDKNTLEVLGNGYRF